MRSYRVRFTSRLEILEERHLLAADQNPYQTLDVNYDLYVSAIEGEGLLDVSGDEEESAIDALRVIDHLNQNSPILSGTLTNDSGSDPLDLITNDYAIQLLMHNSASPVEARIGGQASDPFVDITDFFDGGIVSLSEDAINEISGDILGDGTHAFEFRFVVESKELNSRLTLIDPLRLYRLTCERNHSVQIKPRLCCH